MSPSCVSSGVLSPGCAKLYVVRLRFRPQQRLVKELYPLHAGTPAAARLGEFAACVALYFAVVPTPPDAAEAREEGSPLRQKTAPLRHVVRARVCVREVSVPYVNEGDPPQVRMSLRGLPPLLLRCKEVAVALRALAAIGAGDYQWLCWATTAPDDEVPALLRGMLQMRLGQARSLQTALPAQVCVVVCIRRTYIGCWIMLSGPGEGEGASGDVVSLQANAHRGRGEDTAAASGRGRRGYDHSHQFQPKPRLGRLLCFATYCDCSRASCARPATAGACVAVVAALDKGSTPGLKIAAQKWADGVAGGAKPLDLVFAK